MAKFLKRVKVGEFSKDIYEWELDDLPADIIFGHSLMIRIDMNDNGEYCIINAVDGYGENQKEYYKHQRVIIEDIY